MTFHFTSASNAVERVYTADSCKAMFVQGETTPHESHVTHECQTSGSAVALTEEWTLKYLNTLASEKKHRQTTRQHKYLPITAFIHRNLSTALAYCYYL